MRSKFFFFAIIVTIFYFIIPLIFINVTLNSDGFTNGLLVSPNSFELNSKERLNLNFYNSLYFFLNYVFFILFVYLLYRVIKPLLNKPTNNYKLTLQVSKFIFFICVVLILKDFYSLILFLVDYDYPDNITQFIRLYRDDITSLIFIRRTHFKILIIISVYIFKYNKKMALSGYFIIILYTILTFSRFEILILLLLHFFVNFNTSKNKKNILWFILIISILLTYRSLFLIYNIDIEGYDLIKYFIAYNLGEFVSVFLSMYKHFDILTNYLSSAISLDNHHFEILFNLLKLNIFRIIDNFFYTSLNSMVFFESGNFINYTFATLPTIELFFFPLSFLLSIIALIYLIKKKNFLKIDNHFLITAIMFVVSMSFRGSNIHQINFIFKIIILFSILIFAFENLLKLKKFINSYLTSKRV